MTGKRITYVGDDAGSLVLIGPSTRVIDLSGKMVLPAFVDDQAHLDSHAATLGLCVALEEGTTPEE